MAAAGLAQGAIVSTVIRDALVMAPEALEGSAPRLASEVYFRSMSPANYEILSTTGRVAASTGETMVSPSLSYAAQYTGLSEPSVLVKLVVQEGTTSQLAEIGVRNTGALVRSTYPEMEIVCKGWMESSAFFKQEGNELINIGLGKGPALDTFNNNLQYYDVIKF
jgi:hypothetical protein